MDVTDILAIYINKLVQFTRTVCLQIESFFGVCRNHSPLDISGAPAARMVAKRNPVLI